MLADRQVSFILINIYMSSCQPADLIRVNLSVYQYRSMYIQANINDKPCMYIQDEK